MPRGNDQFGMSALANGFRAESLVTLDQNGRAEPRLARSWKRSLDGLTWTFSLSPNIFFQDGTPVTAKKLAQLLSEAATDPANRATRPNFADIESITAPDDLTIAVRTRASRALLVDQLADLGLPRAGTSGALGAFALDREQPDSVSFHAFERYYRGKPGVQRVTFRSYRSLRAAWAAMMRGETDAIYEVGRDAREFVDAESGVRVYPVLRPFATSIIFNVQRPQLHAAAVRQALSSMVDREGIVRTAFRDRGRVADGPLWPFHWSLGGNRTPSAGALVALPPEQTRAAASRGAMPARLRFTCLVVSDIALWESTALLVQKQLYDHGVDMRLEAVGFEEMGKRLAAGNFDAVLLEFLGRTPNWVYSFWHSPAPGARSLINTGYRAADASLDRLLAAGNDDEVRRGVADLYRVLHDDPPAIFIAWPEVGRAVSRSFETPLGPGRDVLASSSLWLVRPAGALR